MNCKHCGQELPDENVKKCPGCGKSVGGLEFTAQTAILLLSALVLCALLIWLLYYGATGKLGSVDPTSATESTLATVATEATVPTQPTFPTLPENHVSYTKEDGEVLAARDTVVATMGDYELKNSLLQVFYWDTVYSFVRNQFSILNKINLDYTKPLDQQSYPQVSEGGRVLSWQDYFLEHAINQWKHYQAIGDLAAQEDFRLPESDLEYLENLEEDLKKTSQEYGYESVEKMLQANYGAACTLEDYRAYLTLARIADAFYSQKVEALEVTEEELETYFTEHQAELEGYGITKETGDFVDVRHILLMPHREGETEGQKIEYTEEEWEACRVKAQALLDQWLAGDKTEDSFAALAPEHSEDPGSQNAGGLYENVYKGQMVKPFEDWCFDESRQKGDYGLVRTDYGYHIMYFLEKEAIWIRNCRSGILAEKGQELLAGWLEKYKVEIDLTGAALAQVTVQ